MSYIAGRKGYGGDTEYRTEIAAVTADLRRHHDVMLFMNRQHSTADMELRPLPADMLAILRSTPDYSAVEAGGRPVWFQIESEEASAELVVYRATDGIFYVMAPISRQ